MKVWNEILPWFDREYYAFSGLSILVSVFIFFHILTKDKVQNEKDLICLNGNVINYSYETGTRNSQLYYFWTDNYKCTFQVPAKFLKKFNSFSFQGEITRNPKMKIYILKFQESEINNDKKVFVYHLENQHSIFLNKYSTLKIENSNIEVMAGFFFFILGIGYYILRKNYWKPEF
ncbi:MAG: hypothetical protein GQ564_08030 [Bacteroidales bacterium]|nr:hypothetical protein [Bacteroidales bacterium]